MPDTPGPLLIISRNLPPVVGGIERLMHRLVCGLSNSRHCTVIGPRGSRAHFPPGVRVIEVPHRPAVLFVALSWVLAGLLCVRGQYRAVIAGNGLMRLAAANPLRRCPVITMVYGLDIIVPHRLYQAICLPLIARSAAVIACSSNSARMAREHGVPAEQLHAITPGVDLPTPTDASLEVIPKSAPLLVSVGRLIPRKGIAEFVRHALPSIIQRVPSARFLIIGEDPAAALKRDGSESARIRDAAKEAGVESHVELAGFLDDAALAQILKKASVHVFPVLDLPGDVEGFGMVALEAAAHGVPTVAFDAGGVRDAVADRVSGVLVTAGDYTGFAEEVCAALGSAGQNRERCKEYAAMNGWSRHTARVAEIIDACMPRTSSPSGG